MNQARLNHFMHVHDHFILLGIHLILCTTLVHDCRLTEYNTSAISMLEAIHVHVLHVVCMYMHVLNIPTLQGASHFSTSEEDHAW